MQFSSVDFPYPFCAKPMQRDPINDAPSVVLNRNETQQTLSLALKLQRGNNNIYKTRFYPDYKADRG